MDLNASVEIVSQINDRLFWYIILTTATIALSAIAIIVNINNSKKQLEANHDWNRRSFSITYLGEAIEKIQSTRKSLNELTLKIPIKGDEDNKLSFSDRFIRGNALTEEEIHGWICEWDPKKEEFVKEKDGGQDFKLTEDGDKVRILLINLINVYESIGSAMRNGVLDEEVVKSLMKGPITSNYKFFILYIKHIRKKHGLKNAGKNFRHLYRAINPKKVTEVRPKTEEV